jgi:hypothetical protein
MKNSGKPAKTEALDIELPDLTGMDRFTPRNSTEGAFYLLDEYQKQYMTPAVMEEWKKRERIQVEFKF